MRNLDWSPLPMGVLLVVLLTAGMAGPRVAVAQIYGTVEANGTVVLTNMPADSHNPALRVIVANPDPPQRDAATLRAAASDDDNAARFADVIAEAARKWNVRPELLRAVIAVESKFNPRAVSKKGARGLMQLMPETARRFSSGDLFDPRTNVLAGAQYLRVLLDMFSDDVELALAAYNAGEQAVIRAGYRIPALAETRSYVPAVMALYRRLRAAV